MSLRPIIGKLALPYFGDVHLLSLDPTTSLLTLARHTWGSSAVITSCAGSINQVSFADFPLGVPQFAGGRKPEPSSGGSLLAKVRGPHECHEAKQACGPPSQVLFGVDFEMSQGGLEDGDS